MYNVKNILFIKNFLILFFLLFWRCLRNGSFLNIFLVLNFVVSIFKSERKYLFIIVFIDDF